MQPPTDDSTAQFVHVAIQDLQQQLGFDAVVEDITVAEAGAGVWLTARYVIGSRVIEVSGYGTSLLTAYTELRTRVAEPALVAAYAALVGT
jgi:hypothetical protein